MAKIVWKGLTKSDYVFKTEQLPVDSWKIDIPENTMNKSIIFGLPFILLCFLALYLRFTIDNEFVLNKPYGIIGLVIGIFLSVIHEILHGLVYPKNYKAYIGIVPRKFMFYMSCSAPLRRSSFVLMSLLPMILGAIPLVVFLFMPTRFVILNTILWPMSMIGLVSPCPDYMNVYFVLKAVPKNAYIQDGEDGLYWFKK